MQACNKTIRNNTKAKYICKLEKNHTGRCDKAPFLKDLRVSFPKGAAKINQDAYHTRGNKTKPYKNRSFRWDHAISKKKESRLKNKKNLGIPKKEYATQEQCYLVAKKLTRLIYEMKNAPSYPKSIIKYLDKKPVSNKCRCPLCLKILDINDFSKAKWGKAEIEMWHNFPLSEKAIRHVTNNMSWGHRDCNIAQGEKTTKKTLSWFKTILKEHKLI